MTMLESALPAAARDWLGAEADRLVREWQQACRIRSISATPDSGLDTMAAFLERRAGPLFDRFERLPTPSGAPVLVGRLDGTGPETLLLYAHYDVVAPGAGWTADPFAAEIRDGAVVARGAGDDKADVMARLHALEAIRATRGRLPFSVIWLCEGMEEVGSPGLAQAIAEHRDSLRADACLWESYYRSIDGRGGALGFITVEFSVTLLDEDQHSGLAGVYRSAAGELVAALASLNDSDGRVALPGFYDDVAPFTAEDEALVAASPPPPAAAGAPAGVDPRTSDDPAVLTRRWLYEPGVCVTSVRAGPDPADGGSVLAASAHARADFRLVPDQRPDAVLAQLRRHLAARFPDARVEVRSAIPPARCSLHTPLADAARQAATELFDGAPPVCHAIVPGSGPLHLIAGDLGVATVMPPGTIRPDSGMHGPDENALVEHYLDEVAFTVRLLGLLSERASIAASAAGASEARPPTPDPDQEQAR
jgi:acetylornithine deacetylase/succinyl-diaminopimelate desuccinylase-like protein